MTGTFERCVNFSSKALFPRVIVSNLLQHLVQLVFIFGQIFHISCYQTNCIRSTVLYHFFKMKVFLLELALVTHNTVMYYQWSCILFLSHYNVLELTAVTVTQFCNRTKNQQVVCFKDVICVMYELHLNSCTKSITKWNANQVVRNEENFHTKNYFNYGKRAVFPSNISTQSSNQMVNRVLAAAVLLQSC